MSKISEVFFRKKTIFLKCFYAFLVFIGILFGVRFFFGMEQIIDLDQGKVFRSGILSLSSLERLHRDKGLKTIVNLCSEKEDELPWYAKEKKFALENNIKLIDIPLAVSGKPSEMDLKSFLEVINSPSSYPILIHCGDGIERSGMMSAVYSIAKKGMTPSEALDNEYMLFSGHRFSKNFREFIKNFSRTSGSP